MPARACWSNLVSGMFFPHISWSLRVPDVLHPVAVGSVVDSALVRYMVSKVRYTTHVFGYV